MAFALSPRMFRIALLLSLSIFNTNSDGSVSPADVGYALTSNHKANHCEFFVNGFGAGQWAHNSAFREWIEAYVSVDARSLVDDQGGRIQNVGMYVKYEGLNAATEGGEALFLGDEIEPAYYRLEFRTSDNLHTGFEVVAIRRNITQLAFFVDVERQNGAVDRLWLTNGQKDFTMSAIFDGHATHVKGLGAGAIHYVLEDSPIFQQKHACGQ